MWFSMVLFCSFCGFMCWLLVFCHRLWRFKMCCAWPAVLCGPPWVCRVIFLGYVLGSHIEIGLLFWSLHSDLCF